MSLPFEDHLFKPFIEYTGGFPEAAGGAMLKWRRLHKGLLRGPVKGRCTSHRVIAIMKVAGGHSKKEGP